MGRYFVGRYFNDLSPPELERLSFLLEELGEAQQAIGKILRHGYESYNPTVDGHVGNRTDLAIELGHIRCAMIMLCEAGDVEKASIHMSADEKREAVKEWMHHQ